MSVELILTRWLLSDAARGLSFEAFVDGWGRLLREHGIPVARLLCGFRTGHPEVAVIGIQWTDEGGAEIRELSHAFMKADGEKGSPFADLVAGRHSRIHVSLEGGGPLPYPMLEGFRERGFTDYVAFLHRAGASPVSVATRARGGFSEAQVETLVALQVPFSVHLELRSMRHALSSLLDVYLGHDAAVRVLDGEVQRGTGQEIACAIWFCDMRGFTELSDRSSPRDVVATLDGAFDQIGRAITGEGGHILKFIGDAVLAVFPVDDTPAEPCRRALAAGRGALEALERWNAGRSGDPVRIGVALHVGTVLYGNVGAERRLDFTVIGRAVNEVCRLEALCKPLGEPLVMSQEFAEHAGAAALRDLGVHSLKGVARPVRVFGG